MIGLLTFVLLLSTEIVMGAVVGPRRHVYVLQPSVDTIWGSYMFSIDNQSKEPVDIDIPLILPRENIDFRPQQGIAPEEIKLQDDGSIRLKKKVDKGSHIFGISFKLAAQLGEAQISFLLPDADVGEIQILAPIGQLWVEGSGWQNLGEQVIAGSRFVGTRLSSPTSGISPSLLIKGVPEGRARFWVLGWSATAFIVLGAVAMTLYRQRRRRVTNGSLA
jgi:hypothetical protein